MSWLQQKLLRCNQKSSSSTQKVPDRCQMQSQLFKCYQKDSNSTQVSEDRDLQTYSEKLQLYSRLKSLSCSKSSSDVIRTASVLLERPLEGLICKKKNVQTSPRGYQLDSRCPFEISAVARALQIQQGRLQLYSKDLQMTDFRSSRDASRRSKLQPMLFKRSQKDSSLTSEV